MTIQELYDQIGGNYDHAVQIMRMDKMISKYLLKLTDSDICDKLKEAAGSMDPGALFESAHAMKGVCANLGLDDLAAAVSEVTEEYRPGAGRKLSDDEVKIRLDEIFAKFEKTKAGIEEYKASL
jgi:HPt (histidine-containing phosphotransfer) domain-containing protein